MVHNVKIWRYYLPSGPDQEWAEVLLTSTGMFAATSDWGHYAYPWRSFVDRDFREFVAGLGRDWDYAAGKFSGSKMEYDAAETLEFVKRHILDYRRQGIYDREFARREWDLLSESNDLDTQYNFYEWHKETKICDAGEFACRRYARDVESFCRRILPRLAQVLRAELEKERSAT